MGRLVTGRLVPGRLGGRFPAGLVLARLGGRRLRLRHRRERVRVPGRTARRRTPRRNRFSPVRGRGRRVAGRGWLGLAPRLFGPVPRLGRRLGLAPGWRRGPRWRRRRRGRRWRCGSWRCGRGRCGRGRRWRRGRWGCLPGVRLAVRGAGSSPTPDVTRGRVGRQVPTRCVGLPGLPGGGWRIVQRRDVDRPQIVPPLCARVGRATTPTRARPLVRLAVRIVSGHGPIVSDIHRRDETSETSYLLRCS